MSTAQRISEGGGLTASDARRMSAAFFTLPLHRKIEVAAGINITGLDLSKPDVELAKEVFRRATETNKVTELRDALLGKPAEPLPPNPPPLAVPTWALQAAKEFGEEFRPPSVDSELNDADITWLSTIIALRSRLTAAQADSRRLDWLEEQGRTGMTPDWDDNGFWFTRIKGEYRTENTLRSIIDTARKEGAEDPKR